jgi:hypothetical protein
MGRVHASRRDLIVCTLAAGIAAAAASTASGSSGRHSECEAVAQGVGAANVCYGALPPVRARVVLRSRNSLHVHGVAWITFGLHETRVVIRLRGVPKGFSGPAHLRVGGCWGRGVEYGLGNVVRGRRTASIDPVARVTGISIVVGAARPTGRAAVVACGMIPRG